MVQNQQFLGLILHYQTSDSLCPQNSYFKGVPFNTTLINKFIQPDHSTLRHEILSTFAVIFPASFVSGIQLLYFILVHATSIKKDKIEKLTTSQFIPLNFPCENSDGQISANITGY